MNEAEEREDYIVEKAKERLDGLIQELAETQLNTKAECLEYEARAYPYGIALPSTAVDSISAIDLSHIQKIVFIENKTNYDEYLISELKPDTLAVYHGGFLSPQKKKLISKIAAAISESITVFFWADIDLGGFQMFAHLQQLITNLQPMRMSGEDVALHWQNGLNRSEEYLDRLRKAWSEKIYPLFDSAIQEILKRGVTIEQETFLIS